MQCAMTKKEIDMMLRLRFGRDGSGSRSGVARVGVKFGMVTMGPAIIGDGGAMSERSGMRRSY